jgi:hypothetical protein
MIQVVKNYLVASTINIMVLEGGKGCKEGLEDFKEIIGIFFGRKLELSNRLEMAVSIYRNMLTGRMQQ